MSQELKAIYEEIALLRKLVIERGPAQPSQDAAVFVRDSALEAAFVQIQNKVNALELAMRKVPGVKPEAEHPVIDLNAFSDGDVVGVRNGKLYPVKVNPFSGLQDGILKIVDSRAATIQPSLSDLFPLELSEGDCGSVLIRAGKISASNLIESESVHVLSPGDVLDIRPNECVTEVYVSSTGTIASKPSGKPVGVAVAVGVHSVEFSPKEVGVKRVIPSQQPQKISVSAKSVNEIEFIGVVKVLIRYASGIKQVQ